MIGSLSGLLSEIQADGDGAISLVLDVGGVGYEVVVGSRHAATLGALGTPMSLAIHTHVREGAITLYGFAEPSERRTFEILLSAHGVGPALALGILSFFSPSALANAIVTGDVDALSEIPGIGRKTAQRLIVDLSQRFAGLANSTRLEGVAKSDVKTAQSEARAALVVLGYGPAEIRHALDGAPEDASVEDLIRNALRELAPQR